MTELTPPQEPSGPKTAPKPARPKKPAFNVDIEALKEKASQLTETQWGMLAGGIFLVGYVLYEFVLMAPPAMVDTSANAPMQQATEETEEQRFKRENQNVKLPDGSAVPKEAIEAKTQLTQQIPFGDKELEFVVRLPKTWRMSEFARYGLPGQESYDVLTNIARYFGPAIEDSRPFLWVDIERLKRYTSAETWIRAYMIKRGISPQAVQVISPTEVQALYVDVRDDFQTYAVRSRIQIIGDTLVMTSFGVPLESYKEYKDLIGLSLNSFRMLRPNDRVIEKIQNYKLLNIIGFDYFDSWVPKNEYVESTLSPSVELHNPQVANNPSGELLQGLILVNAWRKSSQFPQDRNFEALKGRLRTMSLVLKDPAEKPEELAKRDDFISITRSFYVAQVNNYVRTDKFDIVKNEASMTKQEVWITILDNGYYVAYVTLVTPPRATNYVTWAQNMAAYDLLVNSFTLRSAPQTD